MKSNVAALALLLAAIVAPIAVAQETKEVRIVQQFGLSYLPLHLAVEQKLIEKQARAAGLGDITVTLSKL
ncbi:MAG TPA: ABC transporter substrate-binding protein, partial [Burkholderiales bacterium]|nr:ABC transporter substrate-binding protein [Burkholderiales bacterium]